jgi:transcriptional regulator
MPPVGFEHTISAGERLPTDALDRAATGTGLKIIYMCVEIVFIVYKTASGFEKVIDKNENSQKWGWMY